VTDRSALSRSRSNEREEQRDVHQTSETSRSRSALGHQSAHARALALDRTGPRFLKVGGRVVYRVEDIEAYEAGQLRTSTLQPEAPAQAGVQ
jgi:hypothetical protein